MCIEPTKRFQTDASDKERERERERGRARRRISFEGTIFQQNEYICIYMGMVSSKKKFAALTYTAFK